MEWHKCTNCNVDYPKPSLTKEGICVRCYPKLKDSEQDLENMFRIEPSLLENADMKSLIRLEWLLEEVMFQIENGNQMGEDYMWHTCRVALMDCATLIDRLYDKP